MTLKKYTYIPIALCVALFAASGADSAHAAEGQRMNLSPLWDNEDSAVSSLLLAAGMYGYDGQNPLGINLSVSNATNQFMGLSAEPGQLDEQSITLSYSGSSGKLGFSAGYIYTGLNEEDTNGATLSNLESQDPFEQQNPWYVSLNLSKSFRVNDNIALGVGSRAMLMKSPFEDQDGRLVTMLLNLPLSYKEYFTITPELQWIRPLPTANTEGYGNNYSNAVPTEEQDVIFGGMSISFSY